MPRPYVLVAPNGARRTRKDHPAVPIDMDQIIQAAQACAAAGADGLHLHIRDDDGQHTLEAGRYRETIAELAHRVPSMDVQITTEAVGRYTVEDQLRCIEEVKPAWVSIAVREVNRAPDLASRVYGTCADLGAKVQHILYDADDADLLDHWLGDSTARADQTDRLVVLGRYATGENAKPSDLDGAALAQTAKSRWMACAFGPYEHDCLLRAAQMGGDIRVGFENSLSGSDGAPWTDNAASVSALIAKMTAEGV
ncbi:3-keto-5-aminohexanoate cleavage protein [Roseovarius sp. 2305UL8-3]|uniref:3-keto-5-aminohexanoate cleavage protein n=1 Tax=Roseovarius conchicola TaxID=3121636 RepID=UPI003527B0B4